MDAGNPESSEDDVWGSWEEMEDSGALDERLEKELKSHQMTADRDKQSHVPIVIQENSTRTAYQPQLKILKRPTEPDGGANGDLDRESKQNAAKTKTLAEREVAYAEARKRIMGSATSDYPDEDLRQGAIVTKPSTSRTRVQAETEKRPLSQAKGKR